MFLTNSFTLLAGELFLKWIKQFFGTSDNAVKSQILIAVAVYALLALHGATDFFRHPL